MALLLGVLAVLQYRWVGQLSADERERLRSHADNQAENLTEDFNRELTRAFFWLQVGPELRRDAPLDDEVEPLRALVLGGAAARAGQDDLPPDRADHRAGRLGRGALRPRPGAPRGRGVAGRARSDAAAAAAGARRPPQGRPAAAGARPVAGVPALLIPRIGQLKERADGRSRRSRRSNGYTVAVLDRALPREGSAAAARRAPLPAVAGSERLRRDLRPRRRLHARRRARCRRRCARRPTSPTTTCSRSGSSSSAASSPIAGSRRRRRGGRGRHHRPRRRRGPRGGPQAPPPAGDDASSSPRGPRQRLPRSRRSGRAGRSRWPRRRAALERPRAAPRRLARHRRLARAVAQPAGQLRRAAAARREHGPGAGDDGPRRSVSPRSRWSSWPACRTSCGRRSP